MKIQSVTILIVAVLFAGGGAFLLWINSTVPTDTENSIALHQQQGNVVGHTAIDFEFEDIDGNVHRLVDMHNSTIVITGTPIDCHNCVGELLGFASIWESISHQEDIHFFTISMHPENTLEEVSEFRTEQQIGWPIITTEQAFSFLRDYAVAKPGTTIVIGKGGTIIHRDEYITKPSEIREILKKG